MGCITGKPHHLSNVFPRVTADRREKDPLDIVLVTSASAPRAMPLAAAVSAFRFSSNNPNTAEPLPDIAAYRAPARRSSRTNRAISGCRTATGGSRSFPSSDAGSSANRSPSLRTTVLAD
jgi:hypothetical protein